MKEYGLTVSIELVPSRRNMADVLMRVQTRWLRDAGPTGRGNKGQGRPKTEQRERENEDGAEVMDVVAAMDVEDGRMTHETSKHPEIDRTGAEERKREHKVGTGIVEVV